VQRSMPADRLLHLLSGPKMGFSPRVGVTHYSDKRAGAKFYVYQGRSVRIYR